MDARTSGDTVFLAGAFTNDNRAMYTVPGTAKLNGTWQHIDRRVYVDQPGLTPTKLNFQVQGPLNSTVYFQNVKLLDDNLSTGNVDMAYSLVNNTNATKSIACPAVNQAFCSIYVNAATGASVSWLVGPTGSLYINLAPRTAMAIRLN
jgi:hypothetical protein